MSRAIYIENRQVFKKRFEKKENIIPDIEDCTAKTENREINHLTFRLKNLQLSDSQAQVRTLSEILIHFLLMYFAYNTFFKQPVSQWVCIHS